MNKDYNSSQWPPPPDFGSDAMCVAEAENVTRILTQSANGDATFGIALSIVSFTLLIFILVNPVAGSVLPVLDKLSVGLRLLTDWLFASLSQYLLWKFFRRLNFRVVYDNLVLASIPASVIWFLLSILAWVFG